MKITKLIFQLNYKTHMLLFDQMNQLIYKLQDDNTEIKLDSHDQFLLFNVKRGVRLEVNHGCLNFQFLKNVNGNSRNESTKWLFEILEIVNEFNPIKEITRIGCRIHSYKSVEMTFEELVELFNKKLFRSDEVIMDLFGKNPKDLMYVMDYQKENYKYRFRSGPVQKDQLIQENAYNSKQITHEDFIELSQSFSDNSIFIDDDCFVNYKKEDLSINEMRNKFKEMIDNVNETCIKFSDYLVR